MYDVDYIAIEKQTRKKAKEKPPIKTDVAYTLNEKLSYEISPYHLSVQILFSGRSFPLVVRSKVHACYDKKSPPTCMYADPTGAHGPTYKTKGTETQNQSSITSTETHAHRFHPNVMMN